MLVVKLLGKKHLRVINILTDADDPSANFEKIHEIKFIESLKIKNQYLVIKAKLSEFAKKSK